jgi:signal transduction histidine kinase
MVNPVLDAFYLKKKFNKKDYPVSYETSKNSLHLPSGLDLKKKELEFQTTLNKLQLRTIEEERRKLGSTLHDDLGQILNLMHMQLSELKKIHVSHDLESSSLKMTEELCNAASEKCSSISKMLFPATLIRLGFIEGLHELISDIQHATGIHIVFKHDDFEISDDRASNLFRIFQELLIQTGYKVHIPFKPSTKTSTEKLTQRLLFLKSKM